MFYRPENGHGLPHNPFNAIIAPRPIGWISTLDEKDRPNIGPYSFFNLLSSQPPLVYFSSDGYKHSASNARDRGEFVVNLATRKLAEAVNATSIDAPEGTSEFDLAALVTAPCVNVAAPRIAASPAALECKVTQILEPTGLDGTPSEAVVVIGQIVGVHIDDAALVDGLFDMIAAGNLARLGYMDYSSIDETFQMRRPRWADR